MVEAWIRRSWCSVLSAICITVSTVAFPAVTHAAESPRFIDATDELLHTRYIKEGDAERTTSKCIGNPITPLCVADTYQAQYAYDNDRLFLQILRGKRPGITNYSPNLVENPRMNCYRIIGYWAFYEGDLALEKADFIKSGDVAIHINWRVMTDGVNWGREAADGVCDLQYTGYPFRSLLTRKGPHGWYVVVDHHVIDYVRSPGYYSGQKALMRDRGNDPAPGFPAAAEPPRFIDATDELLHTRYIKEGDAARTTSKCIGNPITPLCVADTYRAQYAYNNDALFLQILRGKRPGITDFSPGLVENPRIGCYRIIGYWEYYEGDRVMEEMDFIKPGDVAIHINWGVMTDGVCNLRYTSQPFQWMLTRKGPHGWYVVVDHHVINYVRAPRYSPGRKARIWNRD